MELVEPIEELNKRLVDHFGIETSSNQPMWRIVWSEDEYEVRLTDHTKEGFQLLYPIMALMPKYKHYIRERFILERLVIVPSVNKDELATRQSYEPMWVFTSAENNYLPPTWEATKLVIDTMYAAMGKKSLYGYVKYKEGEDTLDARIRVSKLYGELYGNETRTGDALATKSGVGYTTSEEKK